MPRRPIESRTVQPLLLLRVTLLALLVAAQPAAAAIAVHPNGVNVSSQGATTVFLTFGGVGGFVAAEAFWCGALVPAAPAIGLRCDPATIFGTLPIRYDLSRPSGAGGFTDIMSIPASVARRAYQAAERGAPSSFYYVRRFVRVAGGPDEFVAVTCRMAGGGARVPLALTHVVLTTPNDAPVVFVTPGAPFPPVTAVITYTGTGRLKGRWEVAQPGDEPPTSDDLLTEATLPVERRRQQRRYAEVGRFNLFLPPTGRVVLPGPVPSRVPTVADGAYQLLLRVEVSDDKEGDSDLSAAGAGSGVVHAGAVAGFPLPTVRYVVGASETVSSPGPGVQLISPAADVGMTADSLDFVWAEDRQAAVYRFEIRSEDRTVLTALLPAGVSSYRAPPWLRERAPAGLDWRVVVVDARGRDVRTSAWRRLRFVAPGATALPTAVLEESAR
jgi:hypothetical protein